MPSSKPKFGAVLTALALIAVPFSADVAAAQAAPFEAVHFERQRDLHLDGNASEVFSLFEPKGRTLWAHDFAPQFLYPADGNAQAGAVFRAIHRGGDVITVWLLADYEPEAGRMRYVINIPDIEAWELKITCVANPEGGTTATVEYRITALSEEANGPVTDFFANRFDDAMDSWERAINDYLSHSGH